MPHLLACVALLGCRATIGQAEKGGLVAYPISEAALDRAHEGRRLALLVGVPSFDDPEWRPLRYAAKDALDLAQVLADPTRGAFSVVRTLTDPEQVTHEGIRRAIRELAAENSSESDEVMVYLSSHGTLGRDALGELRRYLVVRDTRMADVAETGLSLDELKADFDAMRSRKKVLVLATCHSGSGKSLLPASVQRELNGVKAGFFVRPMEEFSRASIVLAACDWGETAREDEGLQNDIYTHFLVEALAAGADRNGDGAVSATEAHDYARRRTFEFTQGKQRPSAEMVEVGADPVVLSGQIRDRGSPELYSYASRFDGFTARVDGIPLGDFPGGVALKEGTHRVQIAKGGGPSVYDGDLTLGVGERLAVEELFVRDEPLSTLRLSAGYEGFLDSASSRAISSGMPALGLSFSRKNLPLPGLSLAMDVGLANGNRSFTPVSAQPPVPFQYTALTFGVGAPYSFSVADLHLFLGPRLSGVYLLKRFRLSALQEDQDYFTLSPGLTAGLSYPIDRHFDVGVSANLNYLYVRLNGQGHSSGFAETWSGLGYRF